MIEHFPYLRIRYEGSKEEIHLAPFTQSGRLIAIEENGDEETAVMQVGRTRMRFFVSDFVELFEGHDNARRFLRDAAKHQDYIEINVTRKRLSYHNEEQYARICQACPRDDEEHRI